jgi:SulP family sulfate permease
LESRIENKQGSPRIIWPKPLAGLQEVKIADLPDDISSGLTLAALVIPLNIGYAQVAGLPATMGLYAAIFPLIFFALFTSSRHVVGGPGPAAAALVAAALAGFAAPGDPQRIQYALALALICSILFFLAWLFRLAALQNFLSRAVLIGFVSGLGIAVLTSQVRKILGVSVDTQVQLAELTEQVEETFGVSLETQGYFLNLTEMIGEIPHASVYAVAIGLASLFGVRLIRRIAPKVPAALFVLVIMTTIVSYFGLDERGVSVLGELPAGLPDFALPAIPPGDYLKMLPGAIALVAITLCEGLLLSRTYAQAHGYKADGNQLSFAYGICNAVGGLSGSMVSGNSVSRSAAMTSTGANAQMASLVAAAVVAIVLLFFTKLLTLLPNAALGGIVASSVISLIEVANLKGLFRVRRSEFWVALTCLIAVLVFGPLKAVVIAFGLSVIDLLGRASRPHTSTLHESSDGQHFITERTEGAVSTPGVIVYRFSAPLFFANANVLTDDIQRLVKIAPEPVRKFVLDAAAMSDIDTTGTEVLSQIRQWLQGRNITLAMSRVQPSLMAELRISGLLEEIGQDNLFATNRGAISAFRSQGLDV